MKKLQTFLKQKIKSMLLYVLFLTQLQMSHLLYFSSSENNKCNLKMATINAEMGKYEKAIKVLMWLMVSLLSITNILGAFVDV